uniref:PGAP2-interacting protein n=1 Tax=Strigamia maritima TaxID=126957 RepID=T1JCG1_STRMM
MDSKKELLRNVLSESILGFQFWSLFTGLFPMVWFYPLNQLDITGYEVLLGVLLVPIFCENDMILSAIKSRTGLGVLRVISLASVASFQAPTTFIRLLTISVGTAASILVLIATLSSNSLEQRFMTLWGLLFGYFATLVGRIWYISLFPTWADLFSNNLALTFGAIATIDRLLLGTYLDDLKKDKASIESLEPRSNWFFAGIGFGSFLYVLTAVYGDVSVVCRWVGQGYPNNGPDPNPWGSGILHAVFVGIVISMKFQQLPYNILWWSFGCCGLFALYFLPTYIGFAGGIILAIYLMSIGPALIDEVFLHPPGRSVTVAMATFMLEILFSIWTIAYNFVPGGVYTREHTGVILLVISITWFISLCWHGDSVNFLAKIRTKIDLNDGQKLLTVLIFLLTVGLTGFVYRLQPAVYEHKVEKVLKRQITTLIWTFHFGFDNEGWPSLERAAKLLNESGADVITLLESDASKPYLGNNDLGMWLGEKLKMYVDFGPSTKDHTWGNLILSKYPIVYSVHHLLPSPHGELAPAISATVNVSGVLINLVTSHMGNDRDNLDRQLQAEYLSNLTARSHNPVILLAYVTSAPGSRDYQKFLSKGRLKDIDDTDRDRWCEYIMYRGLIRLGYARISHGGLSDTELQLAKFEIPDFESKDWVDNDAIEIDPSKVPNDQKFNSRFGTFRNGHNWARTHQFHASTPKYFLPLKKANTDNDDNL